MSNNWDNFDFNKALDQAMSVSSGGSNRVDLWRPKQRKEPYVVRLLPRPDGLPPIVPRRVHWGLGPNGSPIQATYDNPCYHFGIGLRVIHDDLDSEHPAANQIMAGYRYGIVNEIKLKSSQLVNAWIGDRVEVWEMSGGAYKAFLSAPDNLFALATSKGKPKPNYWHPENGNNLLVKFNENTWSMSFDQDASAVPGGWVPLLHNLEEIAHAPEWTNDEIISRLDELYGAKVASWGFEWKTVQEIIDLGKKSNKKGKRNNGQGHRAAEEGFSTDGTTPEPTTLFKD